MAKKSGKKKAAKSAKAAKKAVKKTVKKLTKKAPKPAMKKMAKKAKSVKKATAAKAVAVRVEGSSAVAGQERYNCQFGRIYSELPCWMVVVMVVIGGVLTITERE